MFQRGGEPCALLRVVAQPVQQLGKAPFARIDAPAPADGFQVLGIRRCRDLAGFLPRPVVAPQIVIVNRFQFRVHGNHARSRGVERDRFNRLAVDTRLLNRPPRRFSQRRHVVRVTLRGVVRVLLLTMQRILRRARAQTAPDAIENGNAYTEGAKIDTGDDAHGKDLLKEKSGAGSSWADPA